MSLQVVQSRYDQLGQRIACFLKAASEANKIQEEMVRDNVKKILCIAFERKKKEIKQGSGGRIVNQLFSLASLIENNYLQNLGESTREKIVKQDQEIMELDKKFWQAQMVLLELPFESMTEIVSTLQNYGIKRVLELIIGPGQQVQTADGVKLVLKRINRKQLEKDSGQKAAKM